MSNSSTTIIGEQVTDDKSLGVCSIATRLREANERKSEGNDCFRQSKWDEAAAAYQAALNLLPVRNGSSRRSTPSLSDDNWDLPGPSTTLNDVELSNRADGVGPQLSEIELQEVTQLRSVLFANLGACHVKLGEHKKAVEACTQALHDNPTYEKALQRRAASNEVLDSWTSLSAAQEDYNTLLSLVTPGTQKLNIEAELRKLKPKLEAAQKKETSEMLDKLKGLGDSLLGNFGLSTDNFKLEPNGQGGYSMNFVR